MNLVESQHGELHGHFMVSQEHSKLTVLAGDPNVARKPHLCCRVFERVRDGASAKGLGESRQTLIIQIDHGEFQAAPVE